MSLRKLLKPTKPRIKWFLFFIIGMFVFQGVKTIIRVFLARSLGPEEYVYFITSISGTILAVVSFLLYLVWIYILIAIIYSKVKKKD